MTGNGTPPPRVFRWARGPRSISSTFLASLQVVFFITVAVMGYFWIANVRAQFADEAEFLRQRFIDEQKASVRNEVEKVVDYIEFRRSRTETTLRRNLEERVEEAHAIATSLFEQNRHSHDRAEIEKLIKDALRPIRFNHGRGYYFAVTMDGVEKLYPVAPQFEDQNLLGLQDAKGNFVIRDEIELVRRADEGFVRDFWRKPNARDDMVYPKLTFVKAFKPLDWYLGTGEYLDDFEHDLQEDVIDRIARIRFGDQGYVFLNTYDGMAIVTDGKRVTGERNLWDLTDPDGVKVIQEERRAVDNPRGEFVSYSWPRLTGGDAAAKVSFVKGYPDWQWMIGAGFYVGDIEPVIAAKQASLRRSLMAQVLKIALIMASLTLVSLALTRFLSRRTRRSFDAFLDFFDRAAAHSDPIDPSRLHFSEFVSLAEAANEMISARQKIENEKVRLQEMLVRAKKMESLGVLTGGVAHDLNNILSGIVTYPDMLLMTLPEDSPLREDLAMMRDSALRAAAVVADLQAASRGTRSIPEVLRPNEAVESFLDSAECVALRSHHPLVEVRTRLKPDVPAIFCSPINLTKALMNLVINAVEAIEGPGTVTVSSSDRILSSPHRGYDEVPPGHYVVLTVEDTGSGITDENLARIFEPYYTKKVLGRSGTGLGLAVVWSTVHGHDGFVDVRTAEGGTAFDLYFPACSAEVEAAEETGDRVDYSGRGERLLVVDDEPQQRRIASKLLTQLGYKVETAASGEEAVQLLAHTSVDLVVLDMVMDPGMSGLETYRAILELHPGQRAVVASGFAEDRKIEETIKLGAGAAISKPYTMECIGVAVRTELDRKSES